MSNLDVIERLTAMQRNPATAWVLFANHTVVYFRNPPANLEEQAKELLSKEGLVQVGGAHGDFGITRHNNGDWLITCHHPDIMSYVMQEEIKPKDQTADAPEGFDYETGIGLLGREKRHLDSTNVEIIHVYAGAYEKINAS